MAIVLITAAAALLVALLVWRWTYQRADRAAWQRLAAHQPGSPDTFDSAMVDDLPGPARRFFRFAIRPGTPLRVVAEVSSG